jgi:hypothetical protein
MENQRLIPGRALVTLSDGRKCIVFSFFHTHVLIPGRALVTLSDGRECIVFSFHTMS